MSPGRGDPEKRFFVLQSESMSTLKMELDNLLEDELVSAVMFRYGFRSGELMADHVGAKDKEDLFKSVKDVIVQSGIGLMAQVEGKPGKKVQLEIERSIESHIYDDEWGCNFTRGYLAGFFTWALDIPYYCSEKTCASRGDPSCKMVLEPLRRAEKGG